MATATSNQMSHPLMEGYPSRKMRLQKPIIFSLLKVLPVQYETLPHIWHPNWPIGCSTATKHQGAPLGSDMMSQVAEGAGITLQWCEVILIPCKPMVKLFVLLSSQSFFISCIKGGGCNVSHTIHFDMPSSKSRRSQSWCRIGQA